MHSSYVEPKGSHFLFYGVIRKKVNCFICSGWLPVWCVYVLLSDRERLWNCVLRLWG